MRTKHILSLIGVTLISVALLAGCGSSSSSGGPIVSSTDADGDGVTNTSDSTPNDLNTFATFTVTPLPNRMGGTFGAAVDNNDSGYVVGFGDDDLSVVKALSWTVDMGGLTLTGPVMLMDIPNGLTSASYAVNSTGQIAGEAEDVDGFNAVVWNNSASPPTMLTPLIVGGDGAAYSINDSGVVVGESELVVAGPDHATLWMVDATGVEMGTPVDLGIMDGGTFSTAFFVAPSGLIVGEGDVPGGNVQAMAWYWDGTIVTGPVDLGIITGGNTSAAYGAQDSGTIVGEANDANGTYSAVTWTVSSLTAALASGPSMLGIVSTSGTSAGALDDTSAFAINDAGNRITGSVEGVNAPGVAAASFWDLNFIDQTVFEEVYPLTESTGYALNSSSQVVGVFANATGGQQPFVAVQDML